MQLLFPTLAVVVLGSVGAAAQSPPDFSGTWTMDLTRSDAAAQGSPIGPVTVAIRQMPREIWIETTQNGGMRRVRYLPFGMAEMSTDGTLGTFRWEERQLVTDLAANINQQGFTLTEVRTLNAAGTEMTVEVRLVIQHGYRTGDFALGSNRPANTSIGKNVFVKAP